MFDARVVPFWLIVATSLGGFFLGAGVVLLGGLGDRKRFKLRLDSLEGDLSAISERITREQKRRAGVIAAEARAEERSDKELQREAERRLASEPQKPATPLVPGFASMFNRG